MSKNYQRYSEEFKLSIIKGTVKSSSCPSFVITILPA